MQFELNSGQEQGPRDYQEDRLFASPQLIAVIDGMGGHARGDEAAQVARDVVATRTIKTADDMHELILACNSNVHSLYNGEQNAPGAVIVVAALADDELIVGHAGDSRALLNGKQVTLPHTGQFGRITNCIGAGPYVRPTVWTWLAEPGDFVVVASDGFDRLHPHEFTPDADLMTLAQQRGLFDNTTFVSGLVVDPTGAYSER